nr:tetratricopeptide repeat protein [uncultured Roseateles sp.]
MKNNIPAVLLLSLSALSVQAGPLKDPQWMAWLDAGKTAELDKAGRAQVQSQPDDAQGYLAIALAAVANGEPAALDGALKTAETCVTRLPQAASCHYALGSVVGQQAMTASMFKMMGMASRIRDAFAKAVELDPLFFEARDGLVQYYLMAPSLAGGSVSKAREVVDAVQAKQPEQAKLMRARIAAKEEKWADAERELNSIKSDDKGLRDEARGVWGQMAFKLMSDKQPAKAKPMFEQLVRDYPGHALGPYGLGRVLTDAGKADEAVALLERARNLEGAAELPIDHRLGIALLAKGDKAGAKAALERFVKNTKANPRNLEDAKKRLAELA